MRKVSISILYIYLPISSIPSFLSSTSLSFLNNIASTYLLYSNNLRIREIDFSKNSLGSLQSNVKNGMSLLVSMISKCRTLERLTLSGCSIPPDILGSILSSPINPLYLDIKGNLPHSFIHSFIHSFNQYGSVTLI